MKRIGVWVCVVACAGWFSARPARAASRAVASAQGECALGNAARGEEKFTGQISRTPAANSFEAVAGKQSATISYGGAVLVCENGQAGSTSALVAGATVVAFGPMRSQGGDRYELRAKKILVTGTPRASRRFAPSGSAATSPGAATVPGGEPSRNKSLAAGGQNRPGSASLPAAIACSALEFSVSVRDAVTGKTMGRASTSPIVCRKAADQVAVQLIEEAATPRRIASLTLSWQNQIAVKLTEAEVTGVQFKVENGAEMVEVTFAYQKVELEHTPSGTHVAL
jgi:hypothetical protein